jgi:hypothetical protein
MTRLLADQTNTARPSSSSASSSSKKYDELDADFKRLFREILDASNHRNDAEEETGASSSSGDKNIDSLDFKTRKSFEETTEEIFAMNAEEEEEEELRAKTSYVMDVSSLEENEALKIARIRERQMKDFEIERLKRTVKMLCEARTSSSSKKRKEDEDAESIDDVLTEYDEELKRREAIIANLREELRETRRNAADDSRTRKPGASSSSALKLNANRNDEKEEILFLRRELRKSETAREKDAAKHHDLALREKRVSLREKAATTRDKRLELLESERGKILARAKTAETAVATLTSSSEKLEKQNQLLLEQLRVLRKREVDADRYSKRLYYY